MTQTSLEKLARFSRIFGLLFMVGGSLGVAIGLLHARAGAHAVTLSFAEQARIVAEGRTEAMWNAFIGWVPGIVLLLTSRWAKSKLPKSTSPAK
jgi:hypothetical protein